MKQQFVFIAFSLATGGAEKRLSCITNHLAKQGHSVKIVLLEDAPQVHKTESSIEIIPLSTRNPATRSKPILFLRKVLLKCFSVFSRKFYAKLDESIRLDNAYVTRLETILREHPDATIVSFMTFPSLATAMALKGLKNKWVFAECTSPHMEFPPDSPVLKLRKKLYRRATGACFQTEEAQSYYTFLPGLKSAVIPNPLPDVSVERYGGERKKTVVTFCRMSYEKNIPLLIDAFAKFNMKHPEYTLALYGDGLKKNEWIDYAERSSAAERIHFYASEAKIAEKLYREGMFVSSSDREGLSNSMLEALAVGLPTICTDCPAGGARMFIRSYENGILVPVGDADKLCDAMCYFAEHMDVADTCSREAVKIRKELEESKILAQWEQFISNL